MTTKEIVKMLESTMNELCMYLEAMKTNNDNFKVVSERIQHINDFLDGCDLAEQLKDIKEARQIIQYQITQLSFAADLLMKALENKAKAKV